MKKLLLAFMVVSLLGSGSLVYGVEDDGDDDYTSTKHQTDWRAKALERTLSVGIGFWRALWSEVTYDNGYTAQYKYSDPDWLFSLDAKLFFYESNFGVGLSAIMMDSKKLDYAADLVTYPDGSMNLAGTATLTYWLADLDLYYRFPLIPGMNLIGGAGLTYSYIDTGDHPQMDDSTSGVGWNIKLGAEYFFADSISVSLYWTYHSFERGAEVAGSANKNASVKLTSLMALVSLYL